MKFRRRKHSGREAATLDMTALIDVVFLLLIFLLITTTFRRDEQAFVIDLVDSSSQQITLSTDRTTVFIEPGGGLHLLDASAKSPQSSALSLEELAVRLEALLEKRPDESLVIRGSKTAEYQRVVDVLTMIRDLGFADVSFAYEKENLD